MTFRCDAVRVQPSDSEMDMSDNIESDGQVAEEPQDQAQDDLGDAGKKAIVAEREARKVAERQASELKARLDEIEQANLSELERAQQRAEAAETALRAKESEALRFEVAAAHGIPSDLIDLLVGDDRDQLSAKAERIAALIEQKTRGPFVPDQGATPDAPVGGPANSFARFIEQRLN